MPLNTLRLNHQRSSHPNDRVVFIKPLGRSPSEQAEYDLADTFLRAIAAQCLPLMKKHYLSVTTLEEYEPNPEFIGRNFNNGEIIQLVLRTKSGGWVPFNMVQMVMMHELAHNSHMNHGKLFWQTRNQYADEMKALWARGYTGEGFWGSGRTLDEMGAVMGNNVLSSQELEGLPLCGGTYRSRRRKRKARGAQDASKMTWKEKNERRIERKFGKNGVALGEDEDRRLALEISRRGPVGGKPRVAQSKRGRELRAAAALARFETNKSIPTEAKDSPKSEDSDEEDEYEDAVDAGLEDALDLNGQRLVDARGQGMVRVCGDEDTDDTNVKHEMTELENLHRYFKPIQQPAKTVLNGPGGRAAYPEGNDNQVGDGDDDRDKGKVRGVHADGQTRDAETNETGRQGQSLPGSQELESVSAPVTGLESTSKRSSPNDQIPPPDKVLFSPRSLSCKHMGVAPSGSTNLTSPHEGTNKPSTINNSIHPASTKSRVYSSTRPIILPAKPTPEDPHPALGDNDVDPAKPSPPSLRSPSTNTISCQICSLENPALNATCLACAHVIDPDKDPRYWSCQSEVCREGSTGYLNAGDTGICGVCGSRRLSALVAPVGR